MRNILCFGDSNTYGLIPGTNDRYSFGIRWTSILAQKLGFWDYHIIEEGLCGRTTMFDDPLRDGRCGVKILPTILETHSPIDLTIIMLGTNDCKTIYGATAEVIAKGATRLIRQVRSVAKNSEILLISPIHLGDDVKDFDPEFSDISVEVSKNLAGAYRKIATIEKVHFLAASDFAEPSLEDKEHLNENGHRLLAEAVLKKILEIFSI
ncbi:MAG: SGNH/GDSL hydrolase family protein [Lachnospiraceae bacterium]|nr:SGNH/GDSL hydrolase family protein [Lachnospiraceae bacterium]MCM1230894.1 SGNH/GDSL hydrolase family protein [Ruminococcus flavefaciens]